MIAQTSLQAYWSLSKDLGFAQQRVFDVIVNFGPLTNRRIAQHLGWEINRVTPRTNELVKNGLVVPGLVVEEFGRKAVTWISKNRTEMNAYGNRIRDV